MTISVMSDLHSSSGSTTQKGLPISLDFAALEPADVLVVAGDIGMRDSFEDTVSRLFQEVEGKFKNIIVLKGNHDYYTIFHKYNDVIVPSLDDNFVLCAKEDSGREVDFICTPMWTPIGKEDGDLINDCLNDYSYIPGFTPDVSTERFAENVEWLEKEVKNSKDAKRDVVIVTHHMPRHELIDESYLNSDINAAFCVIDEEYEKRLANLAPLLWIHGHSHSFMDKTIDGIRYVRNPYGYERTFGKEETGFKNNFIVTV